MTITPNDIVGAWSLVSAVQIFDDGETRQEFGPEASGYLSYSSNGIVSATLGSSTRHRTVATDPTTATDADVIAMARDFIAYAGRYSIDADTDTVTHHIDVALFTGWEGGDQVRRVRLDGGRLQITGSPRVASGGRTFRVELTWTPVHPEPAQHSVSPSPRSAPGDTDSVRRRRMRHSDGYGLAAMTAILFLFFAAAAAPSPLLPLLLAEWAFAPWLLTFAFAVYALAILVALLVAGRLSDHIGRRPVIVAATALELASMIVFLVADDIWIFVVARTLQGLATGAATGAISAAIADFAGERRARLTATLGSVGPLAGLATGAVFAGAVAEYDDAPKPVIFAVLAILFAIALAAVGAVRESSSRRPGAARSLVPRVAVPQAARRAFWKAVPIAAAVWMAGGFYLSVIGETARDLLAISDEFDTSVLIAGLSATGAITVVISRRASARTGATIGVLLIALGMLSSIIAIETASVALLIIGTVVSGAGFGMAFAGAVGLVIPHARAHERGELFSAIYVVNYLAFGVPAIAAGLLITPLGLSTAVVVYAAVVVVAAVIGVVVQARPARRTRPTPRSRP